MAAKSNLVLTPIVDKNGKLTKVYRRKDSGAPSTGLVPPPRAAAQIYPEKALSDALERLHAERFIPSIEPDHIQHQLHHNLKVLAEHSPETVSELVDHILTSDPKGRSSWEWALMSGNIHREEDLTGKGAAGKVRERYRRRFAIQSTVNRMQRHHKEFSAESSTEIVVWNADHLALDDDHVHNYKHLRAAGIYLGIRLLSGTPSEELLNDRSLNEMWFIADNIDAVEPVAEEMAKRCAMDREFITQLIETPQALSEGNL